MPDLEERVEVLERNVEQLTDRVRSLESRILDLRAELRDGFSALQSEIGRLRDEISAGEDATRRVLQAEIRATTQETQTLMRVLHEGVTARIRLLGEGGGPRRPGLR